MGHYFIDDKNLQSNIVEITYEFEGVNMKFKTDNGLFSKEHVDYASDILLKEMPPVYGKVLDLGCGYGPIGVTLSKINNIQLTMVDVNPKAIEFSKLNCELNAVKANVIESNGFDKVNGSFDTVVLNPPIHAGKEVIYKMYEDGFNHLNDQGKFYLIIQKKHGAKTTMEKLEAIYPRVVVLYKKKGFFVLECHKNG